MIWFRCAALHFSRDLYFLGQVPLFSIKGFSSHLFLSPKLLDAVDSPLDLSWRVWLLGGALEGPLRANLSRVRATDVDPVTRNWNRKTFKYCNSAQLSPASAIFLVFSFQLNQPTALFRQDLLARNDLNGWVLINLKLNNRDIWIFK